MSTTPSPVASSQQVDLTVVLYVLFAGALVFFMQAGFALLTAGSIRAKNVKNIILWNLLDSAGGGVAFWACGYAFAFGGDGGGGGGSSKSFVGTTGFFVNAFDGIPLDQFFYQFTFACALSSIVAGTLAERCQMAAYLCYSLFLTGFAYPVVAHAMWSDNGFLSASSIDLAGSGTVHMAGGAAALVAALILGPRIGRFYDRHGKPLEHPVDFSPHSVVLQMLGTFCLWFGWYGFNSGSVMTLPTDQYGAVAGLVFVNTTLAACAGGLCAMFTSSLIDYRKNGFLTYDLTYTMNGCLTGLVAITAGAATVDTWAAVVIGVVAGWVYLTGSAALVRCRIDDAVDGIPVHFGGGLWGMLSTGLLTDPQLLERAFGDGTHAGWFFNMKDFTLMGNQLLAVVFIFAWMFAVMGAFFYALNWMGWFRVDPLEEEVGLDLSRHKGAAYDHTGAALEEHIELLLSARRQQALQREDSDCEANRITLKRVLSGDFSNHSRKKNADAKKAAPRPVTCFEGEDDLESQT